MVKKSSSPIRHILFTMALEKRSTTHLAVLFALRLLAEEWSLTVVTPPDHY